ncbi:hypothetical protein ONE63_005299 [Megalurothrips usitatus]|uniref:Proton channel OtopLc-like n=1 Tax=Megalurothrips usitatus TaxID=439358 RepID=A0AAV7Y1V1_9NEOP|nr:hypothetical protein ONE63_005299 [Megalurothrips usitatus]
MRDRPGHRALRALAPDRERRDSFKDLKDHFPRRLRDPWRDTKFSLLVGASSEPPSPDPGPDGNDDGPTPPLMPLTANAAPAGTSPAIAAAPATSSGTSDMSGLSLGLGLSPRSGLTRRSVSERVLIQDVQDLTPPAPAPSSEREKRTLLRRNLTQILSCVYAVFVVTMGVVVYISSLVAGKSPILAEAFSLYLVGLGLLYLVFLYADIRRYLNRVKARQAFLLGSANAALDSGKSPRTALTAARPPQDPQLRSPRPSTSSSASSSRPVAHDYCFSDASHAASFYLKVGAAGFCFGHLVHSSLLLAYQAMFLLQDPDEFYKCASPATLVLDVLYPVYSFLQLFFIFKYSNVIINRCEELARFALMHCLSSSLCFWVWTILRETMDSLAHYDHQDHPLESLEQADDALLDYDADYPSASTASPLSAAAATAAGPVAMPLITYHKRGALDLVKFMNASSLGSSECRGSTQLSTVLDSLSPYLYPFTIEYSILVVGVLFVIWQNIGNCSNTAQDEAADGDQRGNHSSAASTTSGSSSTSRGSTASLCRPPPMSPQSGFVSNVVLHADCHSANKGLFAGLIVLVGAAISIILFLLAMADSEYMEVGLTVNSVTEVSLLALMTVAVIIAYCRLSKLDVVRDTSGMVLDHLLLFLCIPAFFLYAIFSIVPALEQRSYLSITTILLQVAQVLVQTPFIMDGMRRCSNCVRLRLQKPGRELVTFLIVCNVALWITDTFEIKSVDARDHRADYYGRVLWTMISHATVPLTMLYRFHSSGCLVHIWKSAYEADKH